MPPSDAVYPYGKRDGGGKRAAGMAPWVATTLPPPARGPADHVSAYCNHGTVANRERSAPGSQHTDEPQKRGLTERPSPHIEDDNGGQPTERLPPSGGQPRNFSCPWLVGRRPTGAFPYAVELLSSQPFREHRLRFITRPDICGGRRTVIRDRVAVFDPPCSWLTNADDCGRAYQRNRTALQQSAADGSLLDATTFASCAWDEYAELCAQTDPEACSSWIHVGSLNTDGHWFDLACRLMKLTSTFMESARPSGVPPIRRPAVDDSGGFSPHAYPLVVLGAVGVSVAVALLYAVWRTRRRLDQMAREKDRLSYERHFLEQALHAKDGQRRGASGELRNAHAHSIAVSSSCAVSDAGSGAGCTRPPVRSVAAAAPAAARFDRRSRKALGEWVQLHEPQMELMPVGSVAFGDGSAHATSANETGPEAESSSVERQLTSGRPRGPAAPYLWAPTAASAASTESYGSCAEIALANEGLAHQEHTAGSWAQPTPSPTPQSVLRDDALMRTLRECGIDVSSPVVQVGMAR